jgi:hypothetical protein
MKIRNNGNLESWHGIWPAKKNSRRIVAVLHGTAHAGIDCVRADFIGSYYNRISREHYDWYRLPDGVSIA